MSISGSPQDFSGPGFFAIAERGIGDAEANLAVPGNLPERPNLRSVLGDELRNRRVERLPAIA